MSVFRKTLDKHRFETLSLENPWGPDATMIVARCLRPPAGYHPAGRAGAAL